MKFKVGDKVRIRPDLKVSETEETIITPAMVECAGDVVSILGGCETFYVVEENSHFWTDDMLEEALEELTSDDKYTILINEMLLHCRDTLTKKHEEYAISDHFHNFNKTAAMLGQTPAQALMGMRYKHEVSVCDFVQDQAIGINHTVEEWREKIGDNINYLLILWAMVNMQDV